MKNAIAASILSARALSFEASRAEGEQEFFGVAQGVLEQRLELILGHVVAEEAFPEQLSQDVFEGFLDGRDFGVVAD